MLGALARAVEYDPRPRTGPPVYTAVRQACLKRDGRGALTEFVGGGCGDVPARPPRPGAMCARCLGKLLRVIDSTMTTGAAVSVQAYDAQGRPSQRYAGPEAARGSGAEGDGAHPHAVPAAQPDPLYVLER